MRTIFCCCFAVLFVNRAGAESPDPPISDDRLPISTLVREDIFAGWRSQDMERYARGEKNIDLLLEQRPRAKAELLAWKGGATLYRAVLAHEAGDREQFGRTYQKALDLFAEAKTAGPKNPVVAAVVGGSYVLFTDRLPDEVRPAAWAECYDRYHDLWNAQGPAVDKLPVHISGELLAGLAQASQRTGRQEELAQWLDKVAEVLPGTPYARAAERWKADPQAAAKENISCKTCHSEGRLAPRIAALDGK